MILGLTARRSSTSSPKLREGRRQEVGEEHVGRLDEAEQQVAAFGRRDVEADAPLPAVVHLHRLVHAARADLQDPLAREAAVAVAGDGVLDLDHVGTPVGEQRAARGDEDELRELDDANAVEDRHRRRGGTHGLATAEVLDLLEGADAVDAALAADAALLVAARRRVRAGVATVHAETAPARMRSATATASARFPPKT